MFCYVQITTSSSEDSLEPVSSQLLPSNCKVVLLADVDGDGSLKLITGHADRVVHVHKLQADQNTEAGVQEKLLTGTFGMDICLLNCKSVNNLLGGCLSKLIGTFPFFNFNFVFSLLST